MGIKELILQWRKEEGIEIGRQESIREVARELKKEGLTIDFIAKITKLRVDEIQALEDNASLV